MEGARKDSTNPFFKSKYADLQAIYMAVREPLTKNELAVIQTTETLDTLNVVTTLVHSSGQWIRGYMPVINTKGDAQGMGSAITYARRYSLAAIAGIAQMDDDGNAAVKSTKVEISKGIVQQVIKQALEAIDGNDEHGLRQIFSEFSTEEKAVLWGKFNSQQRSTMTEMLNG